MDPETSLPSHLPTMSPPTTTLSHPSGIFPGQEGPLAIQSQQQQLTWGSSSHILMSHTMLWPKLGTSLRVLRSPGPSLRPPLQPTTTQKTSYMCPGFQPQQRDQRYPQKDDLISSETSQDSTTVCGMWGSLPERASHAFYLIFDRQAARSGDPIAHTSTASLPAAPAISGATVPAHVSDHGAEKAGTHRKLEHQYPTIWSQDRSRGPLSTSRCREGGSAGAASSGRRPSKGRGFGAHPTQIPGMQSLTCGWKERMVRKWTPSLIQQGPGFRQPFVLTHCGQPWYNPLLISVIN